MSDAEKQIIIDSLKPLFDAADTNNLWFHLPYQNLWFHPDELRKEQKEGRLLFSVENWRLDNPKKQIKYLEDCIAVAKHNLEVFKRRVNK